MTMASNYATPIRGDCATAIEDGDFPFEALSDIAEVESWRKEVYRPIYHIHKWWAQRLGSVFRAVVLGAASPSVDQLMKRFYEPVNLRALKVFDPFMGSGTTVGEAAKLGCAAMGRDINPVAYRAASVALGPLDGAEVESAFQELEHGVGEAIRALYRSTDASGRRCDVLYYFWVKVLACPECASPVNLFSSYVFARHAYTKKHPGVQVVCPRCWSIFRGRVDDARARCDGCQLEFDPRIGPARRATAVCDACEHEFPIAKVVRSSDCPPGHRLYAKLILDVEGQKHYLPATEADRGAYLDAAARLAGAEVGGPRGSLEPGYNTKQALGYNYRTWSAFFNERQLLALGMLAGAIRSLKPGRARDALAIVFSGALEFNNLFASYKGEGTGAVRHMFAHHILKPERMPIEANVWGLPQSSGSFSTLYRARLLRALEYRQRPFEVRVRREEGRLKGLKVFDSSLPLADVAAHPWCPNPRAPGVYVSCGDSGQSGLAKESIDLVVTDPPFFDNVHYSELADFFQSWQSQLASSSGEVTSTRRKEEVQDVDARAFASKLQRVFAECHRVLVEHGLLVFSYHHSRDDGWVAVAQAVCGAGFSLVQAHPIKAEMAVAIPKAQAREPIDLDVLIVCKKREVDIRSRRAPAEAVRLAHSGALWRLKRFMRSGRRLGRNDVKILLLSRLLVELSAGRDGRETLDEFERLVPGMQPSVEALFGRQDAGRLDSSGQLSLTLDVQGKVMEARLPARLRRQR
jgi:putative DNA methylase